MTLKSSSKHHTANMRLLLITLCCLAASLALPEEKQKRDILPGDPRYGTAHHHYHPETVVETTKSIGGYAYSLPDTSAPDNIYGPPGYQPGLPVNNELLSPVVDVKHAGLISAAGTIRTPPVAKTIIGTNGLEVRKTIAAPLPFERIKTVTDLPPATSYGTPVVEHTKTLKTFRTAPVAQVAVKEIPSFATTVTKNVISGNPYSVVEGVQLPGHLPSYAEAPVSSVQLTKSFPTTYAFPQPIEPPRAFAAKTVQTLPQFPTVLPGPAVHAFRTAEPLPTVQSVHTVKTVEAVTPVPTVHAVPTVRTLEAVTPLLHAVHPLPAVKTFEHHAVHPLPAVKTFEHHAVHPLPAAKTFEHHAVHPLPALKTFEHHAIHPLPAVKTFEHHAVHPLPALKTFEHHAVHPLPAVKTFEHHAVHPLPAVKTFEHHAIHPLPAVRTLEHITPVPAVRTLEHVTPVPAVRTLEHVTPVPALRTLEHVTPVPAVRTLEHVTPLPHVVHPLPAVKTVETLPAVEPVHHVETLPPSAQGVESLEVLPPVHHVEPVHTVVKTPVIQKSIHIQRNPITDFLGSIVENFPSSLPLPSFPGFPGFPIPSNTVAPIEVSSPAPEVHLAADIGRDSIAVENPLLPTNNIVHAGVGHHIPSAHEYIQPVDANGGYIY